MTEKQISEEDALERVRGLVTYHCNRTQLAKKFGVSQPFISKVLSGRAPPTKAMLEAVDVKKCITYFAKQE